MSNSCLQADHREKAHSCLICHEDTVSVEKSAQISSLTTTNAVVLKDEDLVCGILSVEMMAEKILLHGEAAVLEMPISEMVTSDFGVVIEAQEMALGHVIQCLQSHYPVILKTASGEYKIVDKPKSIMRMLAAKSSSSRESMAERLSI
jgi:hypothetical protein